LKDLRNFLKRFGTSWILVPALQLWILWKGLELPEKDLELLALS
jgi:hypothetical protein